MTAEEESEGSDRSSMHRPVATAHGTAASRQAIVLIHGMGEQIPMDTIKGFVETVWERDRVLTATAAANPTKVWSKPDPRTGSLELRRVTTRSSVPGGSYPHGVRTDFFELYWADLTAGSTWDQFVAWVWYLLLRRPSRVPRGVFGLWILLWIATIVVACLGCAGLVPEPVWKSWAPAWLNRALVVGVAAVAAAFLHTAATRTFGRVVRYTRAAPDNIAARAAVRERGLSLLRALHADDGYERVVVVGHSLGSILAYDLVSYFFAEREAARSMQIETPAFDAVCELEKAAQALEAAPEDAVRREAFRAAQSALRRAIVQAGTLSASGRAWLISDLVTIGSPLAHAEFLLAKDRADLDARQSARELPTCPPYRETLDASVLAAAQAAGLPIQKVAGDARLMVFPDHGRWTLHHAAPFALVRWTNVYDKARRVVLGDPISGPVAPQFGAGVRDLNLAEIEAPSSSFTHTRYWDLRQPARRIELLREVLNLLDR